MVAKIFWVEDELEEVLAVILQLRALGYEVVHANDRMAAIRTLAAGNQYDLLILDERMEDPEFPPNQSGQALFAALRNGAWGDWGRLVPVVFVTGYAKIVEKLIENIPVPPKAIIDKPLPRDEGTTQIVNVIVNNYGTWYSDIPICSSESNIDIDKAVFDAQAFAGIAQLVTELVKLGEAQYREAAERLLAIVNTAGRPDKTKQQAHSFRRWLSDKGDEVKSGIETAANLVTIASPVLAALGLAIGG